ncbi:molybdenum cofactor synthesis 3 [Thelephora terrestris]|uniref:Molybdenum cofactor synthesis 3 n=1 Tax=Thelephora terrestris TaxID=56493 RepID=A0A9P6HFE4_9AGAM|nr:molybdenum cofactor synthesis 3 [Thelephora terrestris]
MTLSLSLGEYQRYGRQMILSGFGLQGQIKLKQSSVVVVGAGGLGCPALQYLAAAGVGTLGIVDHDVVESSNLQRQILHTEDRLGVSKVASAATAIRGINSNVKVDAYQEMISPSNAVGILESYDVILDCTDNPATRYLLSDAAVLLRKPLVSGAAQRYDGQLCVYNLGEDGPCYRCLFPKAPEPGLASSCEETGILGAVTGVIGNLQALEAIKIITGLHDGTTALLLYSALSHSPFRSIRVRKKQVNCTVCGTGGSAALDVVNTDYIAFCGGPTRDWVKTGQAISDTRISASDLKRMLDTGTHNVRLIDVRSPIEFGICHLPESINVPLATLVADPASHLVGDDPHIVVCRLGNDSQLAVDALRSASDAGPDIKDLMGGLQSWREDVDTEFPAYW